MYAIMKKDIYSAPLHSAALHYAMVSVAEVEVLRDVKVKTLLSDGHSGKNPDLVSKISHGGLAWKT